MSICYDRSEAERVPFTNIVDSLVREPARPSPADLDIFQTLISQEPLELNDPKTKSHIVPILNCKLL